MLFHDIAAVVGAAAAVLVASAGDVAFHDPLNNRPVAIPLPEGDKRTDAVVQFHRTGQNVYLDKEDALERGREIFEEWCQACHMPDGSGRIGPSLIDDDYRRERADTDIGKFEVVFLGGAGAMQSFADRLSQDDMLKVIAYIHELRAKAGKNDAGTARAPG